MSNKKLTRRSVLRGLGGAVVGLPLLECMSGGLAKSWAQTAPGIKRFFVFYNGLSVGSRLPGQTAYMDHFVPNNFGALPSAANLPRAMKLLGTSEFSNLIEDTLLVTDLRIPWEQRAMLNPPPGGWSCTTEEKNPLTPFHSNVRGPMLTGYRHHPGGNSDPRHPNFLKPSADTLVHEYFKNNGHPGLRQLVYDADGDDNYSWVSCTGTTDNGRTSDSVINAEKNISTAWGTAFQNFQPPEGGQNQNITAPIRVQQEVLAQVQLQRQQLVSSVSGADRQRLERHFDLIHSFQQRVLANQTPPSSSACVVPDRSSNNSLITERGVQFAELVYMQMICDQVRAGSLNVWDTGSKVSIRQFMPHSPLHPDVVISHDLTHNSVRLSEYPGGIAGALSDFISLNLRPMLHLAKRLKETPEGDGTAFDNTFLIMIFEGGVGATPEEQPGTIGSHSTENLVALCLAGKNTGLKRGQHINGAKKHFGSVIRSALEQVSPTLDVFGEVPSLLDSILA